MLTRAYSTSMGGLKSMTMSLIREAMCDHGIRIASQFVLERLSH